jgi:hypothetical protein
MDPAPTLFVQENARVVTGPGVQAPPPAEPRTCANKLRYRANGRIVVPRLG